METTTFAISTLATIIGAFIFSVLPSSERLNSYRSKLLITISDENSHHWIPICMSITGTIVGGGMFIAVGKIGFEAGVVGYIIGFVYLVGLTVYGFGVKEIQSIMQSNNVQTLADLIGVIYGNALKSVFNVTSIVLYLFLLAGQIIGVIEFYDFARQQGTGAFPLDLILATAALTTLAYMLFGGIRKDIRSDMAQMIVIFFAAVVLLVGMVTSPALEMPVAELPQRWFTGTEYGTMFIIGATLFLTPSFYVRIDMWQRAHAMRRDQHVMMPFIVAGVLSCLFYILFSSLGMWGYMLGFRDADSVTLDVIHHRFMQQPILLGIIFGAFFAAVLSSADTFLGICGTGLTQMAAPRLWSDYKNDESCRQALWMWRGSVILTAILASVIAYFFKDIVNVMVGAFSLLLIFLPMVFGIFVRQARNTTSITVGTVIALATFAVSLGFLDPKIAFAPAVGVAIIYPILAWAVSRLIAAVKPSRESAGS